MYVIAWFQYTTFHLGPIPIQVWGSFVALGMLFAVWIIAKRGRRLGVAVEPMLDAALWMIISGVVFARLFHVFLYEPSFYVANPLEIVKVWHGGLSSFGGVAGAVLAFWWFVRRGIFQNIGLLRAADLFSFGALFGWIVGRIGCVMIHDHMGKPCDCFLAIETPDGTARLDMALLEILFLLPLAVVFFVLRNKKWKNGWITAVLLGYYGVVRFVLDFWRAAPEEHPTGDARYLGLTPAQYFAMLLVAASAFYFFRASRKKPPASS